MEPSLLSALVPFYLQVDARLCIAAAGPSLQRLLPSLQGQRAEDVLTVTRPGGFNFTEADLENYRGQLMVVELRETVTLRGAWHAEGTGWLFACSPMLKDAEHARTLGLDLSDFPVHETTFDSLIAINQLRRSLLQTSEITNKLRAKNTEALAAQRAAEAAAQARSRFLSTMSHEIRTPMNGILGVLELMSDMNIDEEGRLHLQTIRQSSESLLRIVNDALDVAQIEAGALHVRPEPMDLRETVRTVVNTLQPRAAAKRLNLEFQVFGDVPIAVQLDAVRLSQVLFNVIGNAIKFTDAGSVSVLLSTSPGVSGSVRTLALEVRDTGPGMDEEALARLFEAFERADTVRNLQVEGAGLGMAITHGLLAAMGGTVEAQSTLGIGTVVTISLPCVEAVLPEPTFADRKTFAGQVLVVDDNIVNRRVATGMLRRLGLDVAVAVDGADALAQVQRQAFDLIFMDCHMPVMDGFKAAEQLRRMDSKTAAVPIIALTADVLEDAEGRCQRSGMNQLLAKPLRPQELQSVLATWLPSRPS